MELAYTILKGELKCKDEIEEIKFALVFLNEGVYYLETFIQNKDFWEKTKNSNYYSLIGLTEKGYDFECHGLFCVQFEFFNNKIKFVCDKFIKLTNNKKHNLEKNEPTIKNYNIYFVEIENLRMKFADYTELKKYRMSSDEDDFKNFDFDHTNCSFLINHQDFIGNHYKIIFFKNPKNDNLIIDFTKSKGYSKLSFENYLKIKKELFYFLSFINGSQVSVRRELTGKYYSLGDTHFDAQITYLYSFQKKSDIQFDDYLQINYHHSYTSDVFHNIFLDKFDKFYHLNKTFDFISLIHSLNASTNTTGLEEKYFILITALERICKNYTKTINQKNDFIIDNEIFANQVKPEILKLLKEIKKVLPNDKINSWDNLKSVICNVNKINSNDTENSMRNLFIKSKIGLNQNVENLIKYERNFAVHEGIIGKNEQEKIENYLKLDHILRDIILNLIGYKGKRNKKFRYDKEME